MKHDIFTHLIVLAVISWHRTPPSVVTFVFALTVNTVELQVRICQFLFNPFVNFDLATLFYLMWFAENLSTIFSRLDFSTGFVFEFKIPWLLTSRFRASGRLPLNLQVVDNHKTILIIYLLLLLLLFFVHGLCLVLLTSYCFDIVIEVFCSKTHWLCW